MRDRRIASRNSLPPVRSFRCPGADTPDHTPRHSATTSISLPAQNLPARDVGLQFAQDLSRSPSPAWRILTYPTCTPSAPRPCSTSTSLPITSLPPCRTRQRRSLCRPPSTPDRSPTPIGRERTSRGISDLAISVATRRPPATWTTSRLASCARGTTRNALLWNRPPSDDDQTTPVPRLSDKSRMEVTTRNRRTTTRSRMVP